MFCGNCGFHMDDGASFCGMCGARMPDSGAAVCRNCGKSIAKGILFCPECGTKAGLPAPKPPTPPPPQPPKPTQPRPFEAVNEVVSKTVTLIREPQFTGSLAGVNVVINGIHHGKMSSGESKVIAVDAPVADIKISMMGVKPGRARLRLGNSATVSFKITGTLSNKLSFGVVTGAEVIEIG